MMEKAGKKHGCLLVVLLSFCLVVLPAYAYFCLLDDLDITSFTFFENGDQEGFTPASETREPLLQLAFSIEQPLILYSLVNPASFVCQLPPSFDSQTPILRC